MYEAAKVLPLAEAKAKASSITADAQAEVRETQARKAETERERDRIFGIFESRGLLEKDDENSYVAGLELYRICHSVAAHLSPVHLARKHLEALR